MELAQSAEEVFRHWQSLVPPECWSADNDGFGFFQSLRENPALVAIALEPVWSGSDVAARLRLVFDFANDPQDAYFVVRKPPVLSADAVQALTHQHRQSLIDLSRTIDDRELLNELKASAAMVQPSHLLRSVDDTTSWAIERLGDYLQSVGTEPSYAYRLHEAFYSIACDFFLTWHLMWPWYEPTARFADPFASYARLWAHGLNPSFEPARRDA